MSTVTTQPQHLPFNASRAKVDRSRPLTLALWIVSVAVAGLFLMAGWAKLAGAAQMVQTFDAIGVGHWFRYLTGAIEIVSALALLVPPLALFAAGALAATMVGAILTHLLILGGTPAPAVILLAATSFIAWTRWRTR